jgi:ABC-2 type transport system ATP-binding protein
MNAPALELENLSKVFGNKTAVREVTLTLESGAFLGLLGRNGAGKSTTLKMVTGLMTPTSGSIRVLGRSLDASLLDVKREIGVMPEDMALLEYLTGPQYLRFVGRMYRLDDAVIDRRQAELFEKLDLHAERGTLLCDYSYGMKKKIALCAALIHAPRMLFLDEPFEGIDPVTSHTIKGILQSLQAHGVTIILTSHILEIVEKLCPRIAILDEGRLKGYGSLEELRGGPEGQSLESLFVGLVGGVQDGALSWL